MRRTSCLVILAVTACGLAEAPRAGSRERQPIIGGELATGDEAVFALGEPADGMFCTATLIGPRTLLTAAHCVDGTPSAFGASNHENVKSWPADAIAALEWRPHPRWHSGSSEFDVGLVLLASPPPGVAAKPWNRAPLGASMPSVRAIGFGETHVDGVGVRMAAMLDVTGLSSTELYLGGSDAGTSICFGDSGGPAMRPGDDGVERVVGVHSFSDTTACTSGGDVRVDAVADFIDQWTREKDPTCALDGACVAGCPTMDRDCYCVADGRCSPDCPLPDTDSDCPKNCLADGVCAYGDCGALDPDCLVDGASCSSVAACQGHQCFTDAQHAIGYCTRSCQQNTDCDPDMLCSFGICQYAMLPLVQLGEPCQVGRTLCRGGVCGSQSFEAAQCRTPCHADGSCEAGLTCVEGVRGVKYCQGTAVVPALTMAQQQMAHRCSAAPASLGVALAALLALRRRSRA